MSGVDVYLLHIEPAYKHAGHYLGIVRKGREIPNRWLEHMHGQGAVLTRYARRAGCNLILSRIWRDKPFQYEKKLKGRSLKPLCPVCQRKSSPRADALTADPV